MLKHASNAGGSVGGPANGQLRNSTSTTTASNRNIHLRPQQPLNISTLSTNTQNGLQTSSNSATLNGGQRIPTLLNIASTPIAAGATNTNALTPLTQCAGNATTTATAAATGAATTTTTPITPLTPNGIASNLHTYTNQHILACNNINNHNINNAMHNITAPSAINHNTLNNNNNNNNTTGHYNNHNYSNCHNLSAGVLINQSKHGPGPREALTSLGLLCLGDYIIKN